MTEREKARYLTDLSEEYYADGLFIKDTMELEMEGTLMGERMTHQINSTVTETLIDNGGDDLAYLNSVKGNYVTVYNDESMSGAAYNSFWGYADGTVFYSVTPDVVNDETRKRKSECDAQSYREYISGFEASMAYALATFNEYYTVLVFDKKDDNVWNIVCQDLTLAGFNSVTGNIINLYLPDIEYEQYVLDTYKINFKINRDTYAIEEININVKMTFEGENTDLAVSLNHTCQLSLPESDIDIAPDDLDDYDNIGDLMAVFTTEKKIANIISSNVHLNLTDSITVQTNSQKPNVLSKYAYTMDYGIKKGVFMYDVECVSTSGDGISEYRVTYDGMTKTTDVGGGAGVKTEEQSFDAAVGYINNIVSDLLFDPYDVYNIEISKLNGKQIISLAVAGGCKEEKVFLDMGISTDDISCDAWYVMTFDENGNMESFEYKMFGMYNKGLNRYSVSRVVRISEVGEADFSGIPVK